MSYTRHNWIDPETIDAAKLNNIEDGIEEAAQSGGGGGVSYDLVIRSDSFNPGSGTVFTLISGTSTDVYNKLSDGDYTRALLICDGSTTTFAPMATDDSYEIQQASVEGTVICSFYHRTSNSTIVLVVESDGTVILD